MRFFAHRYHASDGHPGDVRELVTVQRGRLRAGPLDEQVEFGPGDFLDCRPPARTPTKRSAETPTSRW